MTEIDRSGRAIGTVRRGACTGVPFGLQGGVAAVISRGARDAPMFRRCSGSPALAGGAGPAEAGQGDGAGAGELDALLFEELALDGAADRILDGDAAGGRAALADDALPGEAVGRLAGAQGVAGD